MIIIIFNCIHTYARNYTLMPLNVRGISSYFANTEFTISIGASKPLSTARILFSFMYATFKNPDFSTNKFKNSKHIILTYGLMVPR